MLQGPSLGAAPSYPRQVVGPDWPQLVVEVDYAPGHSPGAAALDHLLTTLRDVTSKQDVELDVNQSLADTPNKVWSSDELLRLEQTSRRHTHQAPHALLHVLYPSGSYEKSGGGNDIAGVTIGGTQLGPVTIFLDTIRGSSCVDTPGGSVPLPVDQPTQAVGRIERSTLLHEVGHAMGLVDNGISMVSNHEDGAHPGHSPNKGSVMYWSIDTCQGLRDYFLRDGAIPDAFDGDDRADLRSVGGK
jgi:hypothetical protein